MTTMAILYLVSKSIAAFVFLALSFLLLYLTIKSKAILEAIKQAEIQVRKDIYRFVNAGSLVSVLVLPLLSKRPKGPTNHLMLKILKAGPWAKQGNKYAEIFRPIANIIESASELSSRIAKLSQSK